MLQIDGSFSEWFITKERIMNKEDRKACLLNLVDDNTSIIELMFAKQETMKCACLLLEKWINKYGVPYSLYCDRRNMYISNKDYEELNNPRGYFRTTTNNLNINIIAANSAQAKGRVERGNKTHQDRLTKLMRLKIITSIEEANEYLEEEYIKEPNEKFALKIEDNVCLTDIPKEIPINKETGKKVTLDDICYMEEIRKVNNDWTISYKGKLYQLKRQSNYNPPCKSSVYVRKTMDDKVFIFYRGITIEYTILE
jgi:hypothetical protein